MKKKKLIKNRFKKIALMLMLVIIPALSFFALITPIIASANAFEYNFNQALINEFSRDVIYQDDVEISVSNNAPVNIDLFYTVIDVTYEVVGEGSISLFDLINDLTTTVYDNSYFMVSLLGDYNSEILHTTDDAYISFEISNENGSFFASNTYLDAEGLANNYFFPLTDNYSIGSYMIYFDMDSFYNDVSTNLYSSEFTISIGFGELDFVNTTTISDFGILIADMNELQQFIFDYDNNTQTPTDNNVINVITTGLSGFGTAIVGVISNVVLLFYDDGLTIFGGLGLLFLSIGFIGFAFKWVRSFFNK